MKSFPTLGLKNTLSGRVQLDPEELLIITDCSSQSLVAWYDFSDTATLFTDIAGTSVAVNGSRIRRANNKAYDGLGASSKSLNSFIMNSDANTANLPILTAAVGIGAGFLSFTGTQELHSTTTKGECSTNRMGGVTLKQDNHTISFVIKVDNVTETADHLYCAYQDAARAITTAGIESTDDQMHYWPTYAAADIDSNTAFSGGLESWTIIMGSSNTSCADVRTVRIYRNGVLVDTDPTDYATADRDLTANHASIGFWLGRSPGSTNMFEGRWLEFVQYSTALSDYQHDQLNTYYSNKYGIDYNLL